MKRFRIITAFLLIFTVMFSTPNFISFAEAAEVSGYINIFYKTSEDDTKCVWKVPVSAGEQVFLTSNQVEDFDSEKDILLSGNTFYGVIVTKYDESRDAAYGVSGPADADWYLSSLSDSDIYYTSQSYYNANEYFFEDDIYEESEGSSGSSLSGSVVLPGVKEMYSISFASCDATSGEYVNPVNGYKSRIFTYSKGDKVLKFVLSTDYRNEDAQSTSGNAVYMNTANSGSYYIEVLGDSSDIALQLTDAGDANLGSSIAPFDNNRVYLGSVPDVKNYMAYFCSIKHIAQSVSITPTSKTFKYSKVKKSKQTFTIKDKNKVGYYYESTKTKYVTVNQNGKVTVNKKTPRGTYKINVAVLQNTDFDDVTKTLVYYDYAVKTVKVKVK